jgi:hypothetical protein
LARIAPELRRNADVFCASRLRQERSGRSCSIDVTTRAIVERDYTTNSEGRHLSLTMAKSETDKALPVQLMGVHSRSIIVTAPVRADSSTPHSTYWAANTHSRSQRAS